MSIKRILISFVTSILAQQAFSLQNQEDELRKGRKLVRAYENKILAKSFTSCSPDRQDCRTLDRRYDQGIPYKYSKSFSDQFSTEDRGNGTCYWIYNETTNSYKIYQDLDRDGVIETYVPANDNVKVVFSEWNPLRLKVYGITLSFLGDNSLGALVNMEFKGRTSQLSGVLVGKNGPDGQRSCWLSGNFLKTQSGKSFDLSQMSAHDMKHFILDLQREKECGEPVYRNYNRSPFWRAYKS